MALLNYTEIECDEESWFTVTLTLQDEAGTVIPSASIDAITCTLIDEYSGETVNSRSDQDVFDANNGTMHETSGLFTWEVQTLDTTIVNTGTPIGEFERHMATFTLTWDTSKKLHWRVLLKVRNLRTVT